ncbi:MAG: LEPR-XLL domain-containing protein, partial [Betaproteobacteria bacterium]
MSATQPNRILEIIRRMPSLGEIFFFGKLAKLFRAIALWRKQRKLRKAARQEQRRRFLLETLEPRVLLSADVTYGALAPHDMTLVAEHVGSDDVLKLYETGTSNVVTSVILDDSLDVNVIIKRDTLADANGDRIRIDLDSMNLLNTFVSSNGGMLNIDVQGGTETPLSDDHVNLTETGSPTTLAFGLHVTSSSDLVIGVGNLTLAGDFHVDAKDLIAFGASRIDAGVNDINLTVNSTSDGLLGSGLLANSAAAITIDGGWLTGHDITIEAKSTVNVTPSLPDFDVLHVSIATVDSNASVVIKDNLAHSSFATITASGNLTVHAFSDVTVSAVIQPDSTGTNTDVDAAAAITHITSASKVGVEGNSALNATSGDIQLHADNTVHATTTANAANASKGAAVAVTHINGDTTAYISGGSAASAHTIDLVAASTRTATTTAISAAEGATSSAGGTNKSEQALQDPNADSDTSDRAASSGGNVDLAGAVAVSVVNNTTEAYLSGTGLLTASTGNISVHAQSTTESITKADGSTTGGTGSGVGIGVAINIASSNTKAHLDNSTNFNTTHVVDVKASSTANKFSA